MKHIMILGILLLSLLMVCSAYAYNEQQEGDWIYTVESDSGEQTVLIRNYNPAEDPPEVLYVPEQLGGLPVREIGYAFYDYRRLDNGEYEEMPSPKALVLPAGIRKISPSSIRFSHLEEIRIENGEHYETKDGVLFERETHKLISYPRGRKDSGYTIPEGTLIISRDAFYMPDRLLRVYVADSVRTIECQAFQVFDLRLFIPESITTIESGAAIWASYFSSASHRYQVINGMLIDTETNTLLCAPDKIGISDNPVSGTVTIPEGVETIGAHALDGGNFYQIIFPSTLKTINAWNSPYLDSGVLMLPEGLETIGAYFNPLVSGTLVLPSTLKSIGRDSFCYSAELESVVLPEGLETIDDCSFSYNRSLKAVILPSSLQYIGQECFCNCESLESVIIREGMYSIGYNSFRDDKNLKSVVLPQSLRSIGEPSYGYESQAFEKCPNLQASVLPDTVAERFCQQKKIPYRYTCSGLWQADSKEAEEALSLSGASNIRIRLDMEILELIYVLDETEKTESFRIEWKDGHLCMDSGYMDYIIDGEQLTLRMNGPELHLTRIGE